MLKNFNVYIAVLLLTISAGLSTVVTAEEKAFLTVDELIAQDYRQLDGEQILQLMNTKKIKVVDIETEAVSVSQHDKATVSMNREFKETKNEKASAMFDSRLLARAPALKGEVKRKVVDDELVTTDGVRTYRFRLYKKQENIYAVRDIDHGNVFFKVEVK